MKTGVLFYFNPISMRRLPIQLLALALILTMGVRAQDVKELQETGRSFMRSGDYSNAVIVLNRALQQEPKNLDVIRDLGYSYYLSKDYTHAVTVLKPVVENDEADEQCYQIAGNVYAAIAEFKDAERAYRKGLKKFPQSGPLYNEFGNLYSAKEDGENAIRQWEKGIEVDPSFPGNYYNAARYYYATDPVYSLIYAEVFVNMESLSRRTAEMKAMLLDGYKRVLSDEETYLAPLRKGKSAFEGAVIATLKLNVGSVSSGITPETLTMVRSRFVLDWYKNYALKYPFKLFDYERQLMQEGMYDAYNQWIFGAAGNLSQYDMWTKTHADEYAAFYSFQRGRVFKMAAGQYYQVKP